MHIRTTTDMHIFLALYLLAHHPWGAAFFRVYDSHMGGCVFIAVSVLFRVGSAEETNQEVRDGSRARFAGRGHIDSWQRAKNSEYTHIT